MAKSLEALKDQLFILKQLKEMAQKSYAAAQHAEGVARLAKLETGKSLAELKVRVELIEEELGIEYPEPEQTDEDARADAGDSAYKQEREAAGAKAWIEDEHEQGVPA